LETGGDFEAEDKRPSFKGGTGAPARPRLQVYRKIRDQYHREVKYSTVKWNIFHLKNEGLVRPLSGSEARSLGLQVEPDRSGRSKNKPKLQRKFYRLNQQTAVNGNW